MAFVIDSQDWDLNNLDRQGVINSFETLLDMLGRIAGREEKLWVGNDFQSQPIYGENSLWELFSAHSALDLPRELSQELAGHLNKVSYYEDSSLDWPAHFEELGMVTIAGERETQNLDVLWAHSNVRAGKACACIGLTREGIYPTVSGGVSADVHWVREEAGQVAFWRAAILLEGDTPAALQKLAPHAYPNLYFPDSVWRGCNRFNGGYTQIADELRRYLEVFNDYGYWVFTAPPPSENFDDQATNSNSAPSNQLIERRFTRLNLAVSPENPDVFQDRVCREARTLILKGRELYCQWHGKLQAWQNRVHIHSPVPESDDKVIIAFLDEHLPLP